MKTVKEELLEIGYEHTDTWENGVEVLCRISPTYEDTIQYRLINSSGEAIGGIQTFSVDMAISLGTFALKYKK